MKTNHIFALNKIKACISLASLTGFLTGAKKESHQKAISPQTIISTGHRKLHLAYILQNPR